MLLRSVATVDKILDATNDAVKLETEFGPAIAYSSIVGPISAGDQVLINRTAKSLNLGTGGYDFVIANLTAGSSETAEETGHIIKLRYTPNQLAVTTLEENSSLSDIWTKSLDGFPVIACQLHSQIAHAAAAVAAAGKRAVYIMTDTAALPYSFSNIAAQLRNAGLIDSSISTGQSFGGDYESVTLHSALVAAKRFLNADVAIVSQGPGNAGTGTKYGFSGIHQASILDITAALGGQPIAVVRYSESDARNRHRGVSHHTKTSLELVRSACLIPVPPGMMSVSFDSRHKVIEVTDLQDAFDLLEQHNIRVTTMGRDHIDDRLFFEASAAAGKYASTNGEL